MFKLSHIKDSIGNNYLGVKINESHLDETLLMFLDKVGEKKFDILTNNQQKRDGGLFHMTLINVMEYNKQREKLGLSYFMDKLDSALSQNIDDLEMLGIGKGMGKGNVTYFVVIKSKQLNDIRSSFGLSDKDLHITIGFDKKDVFGIPKDETTLI